MLDIILFLIFLPFVVLGIILIFGIVFIFYSFFVYEIIQVVIDLFKYFYKLTKRIL